MKIKNIEELGALITLSGPVDPSMISAFDTAVAKILNDKDYPEKKKATILLSTNGGITWIGNAIYERIRFLSAFVDLRIIAMTLAASAGVRIFLSLPRERRFISPLGKIMIHQTKKSYDSSSPASLNEFRKGHEESLIDLENDESEERRWIQMLATELGVSYKQAKALWIKSHWFHAKEAVERGLAASIIRF